MSTKNHTLACGLAAIIGIVTVAEAQAGPHCNKATFSARTTTYSAAPHRPVAQRATPKPHTVRVSRSAAVEKSAPADVLVRDQTIEPRVARPAFEAQLPSAPASRPSHAGPAYLGQDVESAMTIEIKPVAEVKVACGAEKSAWATAASLDAKQRYYACLGWL